MSVEEYYKKLIERGSLHTAGIRANIISRIVETCDKNNVLVDDDIMNNWLTVDVDRGVIYEKGKQTRKKIA